jgi:dimethylamine/trimethylamine dehydrogenase
VKDWRVGQIRKMENVTVYLESEVDSAQIQEFGADCVAIATGSHWRPDGIGRWHSTEIEGWRDALVITPDDYLAGAPVDDSVLIFDDDSYYMGGVLAEMLALRGVKVTLVTPSSLVSEWTQYTEEQPRIQQRLIELNVDIETNSALEALEPGLAHLACVFTGRERRVETSHVLMVTSRQPEDGLYSTLEDTHHVVRIGDCLAPGTIASAVRSGHRYARELEEPSEGEVPFLRESLEIQE